MAIHLESTARPSRHPLSLGNIVWRDLEVGRFDHVRSGAPWLTDIAAEAAAIAGVPFAAVNLMRSSTQRTIAAVGIDVSVVARRHSMCDAIIEDGKPVHIPDASQDDRWSTNPFVNGTWGNIRFYAAHPLVTPSGFTEGHAVRARQPAPRAGGLADTAAGHARIKRGQPSGTQPTGPAEEGPNGTS